MSDLFRGVIPYINVDGAAEAVEFYKKVFGAIEHRREVAEDGKKLMHCHLEINGGSLMVTDCFPEYGYAFQPSHSFTLQLVVDDADKWWNPAVEAGCTVRMPLATQFWGDRYGSFTDPFGANWAINEMAKKG